MATAVIRSKITEGIVFVFFISTSISHTGLCESPISSIVSSGRLLGWHSYYPRFHIPFLSSLSAWYDFLKNNRRNYWMFKGNSRGLIQGCWLLVVYHLTFVEVGKWRTKQGKSSFSDLQQEKAARCNLLEFVVLSQFSNNIGNLASEKWPGDACSGSSG